MEHDHGLFGTVCVLLAFFFLLYLVCCAGPRNRALGVLLTLLFTLFTHPAYSRFVQ